MEIRTIAFTKMSNKQRFARAPAVFRTRRYLREHDLIYREMWVYVQKSKNLGTRDLLDNEKGETITYKFT